MSTLEAGTRLSFVVPRNTYHKSDQNDLRDKYHNDDNPPPTQLFVYISRFEFRGGRRSQGALHEVTGDVCVRYGRCISKGQNDSNRISQTRDGKDAEHD